MILFIPISGFIISIIGKKLRIDIKAPTEVAPSMAMAIESYIKVNFFYQTSSIDILG